MTPAALLADAFDRVREVASAAVEDLSADQLMYRPPDSNSIGWLVWHLTRVQDSHVAELMDADQVYADGWEDRFDLPYVDLDTGYGHTTREVGAFTAETELLRDYLAAVADRTATYLDGLEDDALDDVVDRSWDPPVTRGARLVSVLADDLQHAGQAAYVRGMLNLSSDA